jgi:MFS family permease
VALTAVLVDVAPLRSSPRFRRLWVGSALSLFGGQMTTVAVLYQVWQATHSAAWTGALGLAQAIPLVLFGLLAGSYVDRVDRRRLYLATVTGQAVCSLVLAAQGFLGGLPVPGVLVVVAAQGCFIAAGGPAAATFVTKLVPREQVGAALALNRIGLTAAQIAGPAIGGLIVGWLGVGGCYLIDAVTFGLAFYGAFGLPSMLPDGEASRPGVRGVIDGLRFLASTPVVRGALLTDLAATVFAMPISLFPLVNAERFGGDPRTLGLFLTALGAGGIVASMFSGSFTRLGRPGLVMLIGAAAWGVCIALFGLVSNAWLGLALLALTGAADTLTVVSRGTLVQLNTPNHLLGRVTAAEDVVGVAGPNLGNVRGGLVASVTSGATALVSGGLLCVAAIALLAARVPALTAKASSVPLPGPDTAVAGHPGDEDRPR